jgi:hypothetical protein
MRELRAAVLNAVKTVEQLPASASALFNLLLVEPLRALREPPEKPLVIVLDALDESVTTSSGSSELIRLMRDRCEAWRRLAGPTVVSRPRLYVAFKA